MPLCLWIKSILSESNAQYVGMYDGQLMTPEVREFVESSEYILGIGTLMTDFYHRQLHC